MVHQNLIQAKFLFERAKLTWEPYRDVTNGVVVSLLQDSVELALWAIARAHSVDIKPKDGFVALLDKVRVGDKHLHAKPQIIELNNSRVNFKHYGVAPPSSEIPRFIESAGYFLSENCREFLGLAFSDVSLADDVPIPDIRDTLKAAERLRDEGDLEEALIHASLAYQDVLGLAKERHFGDFPRLDALPKLFSGEYKDEAKNLLWDLRRFFERFSNEHVMFMLGVDQALLGELERRRYTVNFSLTGNRLGVHPREATQLTPENVNFMISNVTDVARRLRPRTEQEEHFLRLRNGEAI